MPWGWIGKKEHGEARFWDSRFDIYSLSIPLKEIGG